MSADPTSRALRQPFHAVIGPEEGRSYWQPLPSRGHVTVQLDPSNMPYDTFSSGIQVLPPGCSVREHGHQRNHELVHVTSGTGTCTIDGTTYALVPGSTVLFGRDCRHTILNSGDHNMTMFWVFFPPGLEDWFHAIGQVRQPGDAMPDAFPRPENVTAIQSAMHFLSPTTPAS